MARAASPSTCRSCWACLKLPLDPLFVPYGLLCTTHFRSAGDDNGPIARAIGMNSGTNALARATAPTPRRRPSTIVRNVGGGSPGAIDRATLGNPAGYTFCFAEDESDPAGAVVGAPRHRAR